MTAQLLSPKGLMAPVPYQHVAVASGTRHVHLAGQVSVDQHGTLIAAGDLGGQLEQALRNVATGLEAVGATFADVVRLTFFVVDWSPEKLADFLRGVEAVADELAIPQPLPPSSLIGVASLYEPEVLIEVEATAILD